MRVQILKELGCAERGAEADQRGPKVRVGPVEVGCKIGCLAPGGAEAAKTRFEEQFKGDVR